MTTQTLEQERDEYLADEVEAMEQRREMRRRRRISHRQRRLLVKLRREAANLAIAFETVGGRP